MKTHILLPAVKRIRFTALACSGKTTSKHRKIFKASFQVFGNAQFSYPVVFHKQNTVFFGATMQRNVVKSFGYMK